MMKYYNNKAFLLFIFCAFLYGSSFSTHLVSNVNKPMTVVIDPGHGGKDPGAVNKSIYEKDIVLKIGLKLGKLINENVSEVKVLYTRSTDIFVPLIERSKFANKHKADLFISIHANSGGPPATRGTETFVLGLHRSKENLEVAKKENSVILLEEDYSKTYAGFDPNSSESYIMFELVQDIYMDQSLSFADAIQNQFKSRFATPNRGVKQAGLLVLSQSSMPSVLVEAGFLSNQAEANYLNSSEGQQNIAVAILEAFKKFKAKNLSVPSAPIAEKQKNTDNQATTLKPKQETEIKAEVIEKDQEPEISLEPDTHANKISLGKTDLGAQVSKSVSDQPNIPQQKIQTPDNTAKQEASPEIQGNYYSVQIGANTTPIEPVPGNFKGLKEVRREKTDKYYRYYIGKESSLALITPIWKQIKLKFPQAFIVSFVDGKRIIINNSLKP